jgi:hypothetical protein
VLIARSSRKSCNLKPCRSAAMLVNLRNERMVRAVHSLHNTAPPVLA